MNNGFIWVIPVVLAGLFFAYSIMKGRKGSSQPGQSGYNPENDSSLPDWRFGPVVGGINYSKGMPVAPERVGLWWGFDFPVDSTKSVNYVEWFKPFSLVGKKAIRMKFSVTGGAFVRVDDSTDPVAVVSLVLQREGDDWQAQGAFETYRQFSKGFTVLAPGEYELVVPLTAEDWGGVENSHDVKGFGQVLEHLHKISVVFGSGGGRGHGVRVTQPNSRFTLLELEPVG
jgi:hypothetical protein